MYDMNCSITEGDALSFHAEGSTLIEGYHQAGYVKTFTTLSAEPGEKRYFRCNSDPETDSDLAMLWNNDMFFFGARFATFCDAEEGVGHVKKVDLLKDKRDKRYRAEPMCGFEADLEKESLHSLPVFSDYSSQQMIEFMETKFNKPSTVDEDVYTVLIGYVPNTYRETFIDAAGVVKYAVQGGGYAVVYPPIGPHPGTVPNYFLFDPDVPICVPGTPCPGKTVCDSDNDICDLYIKIDNVHEGAEILLPPQVPGPCGKVLYTAINVRASVAVSMSSIEVFQTVDITKTGKRVRDRGRVKVAAQPSAPTSFERTWVRSGWTTGQSTDPTLTASDLSDGDLLQGSTCDFECLNVDLSGRETYITT